VVSRGVLDCWYIACELGCDDRCTAVRRHDESTRAQSGISGLPLRPLPVLQLAFVRLGIYASLYTFYELSCVN
jgi:hypothetical protein